MKLAPTATVCNLSRSKPGDFFVERGLRLPTNLRDSGAVAAAAGRLNTIIAAAVAGVVLSFHNSGFVDYGRLHVSDRSKQFRMVDLTVRAVVPLTARFLL